MIGVGRVYDWYRTGVFDGDDAVSVAHGETGSLVGINIPLVNLHTAFQAACDAGILRQEAARPMMARLEHEYYPLRTVERVLVIARECGQTAFADWYRERLGADPHAFDQKRADALEAFALAEKLDALPREATPRTGSGERDWRTEYHRRWRNLFATAASSLHQRLAYQQIFNPGFPDVWWDFLHHSSGPASSGSPDGFRAHVLRHLGPRAAEWLDDPELRSRITAVICPLPDLADPHEADLLLRGESARDRARGADWLERTRHHLDTHPGRSLAHIKEDVCATLLARIWGVGTDGGLATECGRRGFPSPAHATGALRPFVIGYLAGARAAKTSGEHGHA
ncbi:hypothetical protein GCM10018779_53070 [Streptomyces griseocarneus]|nr:hypothetical protein GCM10018779_53070 [Streptomyces griseocarneus]